MFHAKRNNQNAYNKYMKVKQSILDRLNNVVSRRNIAVRLGLGETAVYNHMRLNKSDGYLTKMKALMAISEESGVPVDQILESDTVEVGQN